MSPVRALSRRSWLAGAGTASSAAAAAPPAVPGEVTLLYTNDFHSAFEPVPAFWLPGSPRLGGAAALAALIERERAATPGAFLLDSGDMFTGTVSALTQGDALMDMMTLLRYDAMGAGNHEFDYGWRQFDRSMLRVPFPVLCANVRHRGSGLRFARPYTVLERAGVRLGVIGVMGTAAARNTIMPSKVAELEFTDPVEAARAAVAALQGSVDAIIVLGHQGLPGPMQSDAENDPAVQRPLDEDLRFCDAVPGVAVYLAAHSHHGLETPLGHPNTGALLVQTYGYGTRLGRLRFTLRQGRAVRHQGSLLKVWTDRLPAHPGVAARLAQVRRQLAPQIGEPFGTATARFLRRYNRESSLGSFCADVMRETAGSQAALTNAGGLRADLPAGPLDKGHIVDAFPFLNDSVTLELAGADLRAAVEQGLTLKAGMVQTSGLAIRYDLARPAGERLVSLAFTGGAPVLPDRLYRVTTNSFLAEGGDGYASLARGRRLRNDGLLSDVIQAWVRRAGRVTPPPAGRCRAAP